MQIRKRTALFFSGALWAAIGCMLMVKGINFLMAAKTSAASSDDFPLVKLLLPLAGHAEQAVLCLVVLSLALGTLKGRTILRRAAGRVIGHIQQLPEPFPLKKLYPPRFYILIACMMSLGLIRRLTGVADDIGGVVDLTIGCALIQGALFYFRALATTTCDTAGGGKS